MLRLISTLPKALNCLINREAPSDFQALTPPHSFNSQALNPKP